MATAFLSHSSSDKRLVRRVAADLAANGVTVWLDEQELLPGARLVAGLSEGLRSADFVMLFVSEAFLSSRWAEVEANAALVTSVVARKGSVIPVLIEDVWD